MSSNQFSATWNFCPSRLNQRMQGSSNQQSQFLDRVQHCSTPMSRKSYAAVLADGILAPTDARVPVSDLHTKQHAGPRGRPKIPVAKSQAATPSVQAQDPLPTPEPDVFIEASTTSSEQSSHYAHALAQGFPPALAFASTQAGIPIMVPVQPLGALPLLTPANPYSIFSPGVPYAQACKGPAPSLCLAHGAAPCAFHATAQPHMMEHGFAASSQPNQFQFPGYAYTQQPSLAPGFVPAQPHMMAPGFAAAPQFPGYSYSAPRPAPYTRPSYPAMALGFGTKTNEAAPKEVHGPAPVVVPPHRFMYISGFCPTRRVATVGLFNRNQVYYYYYFDEETETLRPTECLECQPNITEDHLLPKYSVWYEEIDDFVIFVWNSITQLIEQYSFVLESGGFEQVDYPEIPYEPEDDHQCTHFTQLCNIEDEETEDQCLIFRNEKGRFLKLRYVKEIGQYKGIPPVYVRTLTVQQHEGYDEDSSDSGFAVTGVAAVLRQNRRPPKQFHFEKCPHDKTEYVRLSHNGIEYKFVFNWRTGLFDKFECGMCSNPIDERWLHAKYAVYHSPAQKYIIFVHNQANNLIEQYFFNALTTGFEQVHYPELQFDASHRSSDILMIAPLAEAPQIIIIHKCAVTGRLKKVQPDLKTGQFVELPAVAVKSLAQRVDSLESEAPNGGPPSDLDLYHSMERLSLADEHESDGEPPDCEFPGSQYFSSKRNIKNRRHHSFSELPPSILHEVVATALADSPGDPIQGLEAFVFLQTGRPDTINIADDGTGNLKVEYR